MPAGTYRLTLSDLDITSSLAIVGAGAASTIIESNGQDRVVEVRPNITVTLDKLTIRNGKLSTTNGAGILNDGTLTLSNSVVRDNRIDGAGAGAGIYNAGTVRLSNTTVTANGGTGGYNHRGLYNVGTATLAQSTVTRSQDIYNGDAGILTITDSTLSNNRASYGGGLYNFGTATIATTTISSNEGVFEGSAINTWGTLTLTRSTISGNTTIDSSSVGGSIFNAGTATITNSTISGNGATTVIAGGGIVNSGTLTLASSTVTRNQSINGGSGGLFINTNSNPSTTLRNTIIAGNGVTGPGSTLDCSGPITSQGYNLIGNTTGCTITGDTTGNVTNVDAQLGSLQNNGGPTWTHLPASTSPAIDAGNPAAPGSSMTACPITDQRGVTRPCDGNSDTIVRCDIGAVER